MNNNKFFNTSKIIHYPPTNNSPNFESFFFKKFNSSSVNLSIEYLPIQWTNYFVENNYGNDLTEINNFLSSYIDKKINYFTITQFAGGPLVSLKNTLVFSMGGMFNTPKEHSLKIIYLPLVYEGMKKEINDVKEYKVGYIGRKTHPLRIKIEKKLGNNHNYFIKNLDSMKSEFSNSESEDYINNIKKSYFTLCPRGYGPTSFRLYESIIYGSIPIYISDEFILPFKEFINWEKLAILIKPREINKIPKIVDKLLESKKYQEMLDYGEFCFDSYFNFDFMYKYVIEKVKGA